MFLYKPPPPPHIPSCTPTTNRNKLQLYILSLYLSSSSYTSNHNHHHHHHTHHCHRQGRTQDFKLRGAEISEIFFFQICIHIVFINYQPRQILKKSLFLNILRYNHLPTKIKDMKHYCFLIQSSMKKELDALSNLQNHL